MCSLSVQIHSFIRCISRSGYGCLPSLSRAAHDQAGTKPVGRKLRPISRAMRAYMDRVKHYEEKILAESQQYLAGKRFLANMMGEDPSTFTQDKVDEAIKYLLPSGLFVKEARPIMKPPEDLFPAVKMAAFDETGRPFSYLFYAKFFQVYEIQHETVRQIKQLNEMEDQIHSKGRKPMLEDCFDPIGSQWISLKGLQTMLNDKVSKEQYDNVIEVLDVLQKHPLSAHAKEFIMKYRKPVERVVDISAIPSPLVASDGRLYIESRGRRKSSTAKVVVLSPGTGKILINKQHDITYFTDLQARQQVLFPLQLTGMLNKVDVEAVVHGGGQTGQSGAIRYATATALQSFVDKDTLLKMQIAGLLVYEIRRRERKKPGKRGARRSYTWLKR